MSIFYIKSLFSYDTGSVTSLWVLLLDYNCYVVFYDGINKSILDSLESSTIISSRLLFGYSYMEYWYIKYGRNLLRLYVGQIHDTNEY